MDVEEDEDILKAKDVDAFWLQRQLDKYFEDPLEAQNMANEVLGILQEQANARVVENKLVSLLQFERFELVRLLMKNRPKVVFCTRLGQAQSDEERQAIEEEMAKAGPIGLAILEELKATTIQSSKSKNLEKSLKAEARKLRALVDQGDAAGLEEKHKMLDLEDLTFQTGGRLMSNKRCKLPEGSFRTAKKGYEEVHVPAVKAPPFSSSEKLIPISDLPDWTHPAFAGMKTLNRIQSRLYKPAFFSPENLLLCAPTGGGKTNVAMLTILHEIGLNMRTPGDISSLDLNAFKIVYVAPMKSLVQEMVRNFR